MPRSIADEIKHNVRNDLHALDLRLQSANAQGYLVLITSRETGERILPEGLTVTVINKRED